jgi:hypothetical protein
VTVKSESGVRLDQMIAQLATRTDVSDMSVDER